jgi:hypothetical protein
VTPLHRTELYERIVNRMDAELRAHPGSTAAAYWLPAAARSMGDLDVPDVRDCRLVARPSRPSTAPRFGPISIGWQTAIIPERARDGGPQHTRATPWTR